MLSPCLLPRLLPCSCHARAMLLSCLLPCRLPWQETWQEHGESMARAWQGLPARILVNRQGDNFQGGQDGGGCWTMQVKVAQVLASRKEVIREADAQNQSSAGRVQDNDSQPMDRRPCSEQTDVFDRLFLAWQSEEGRQYMDRIHAEELTPGQQLKKALGYFKTHCDKTFGGHVILKFLIALGSVPPGAVDALNAIIDLKTGSGSPAARRRRSTRSVCPHGFFAARLAQRRERRRRQGAMAVLRRPSTPGTLLRRSGSATCPGQ